MLRVSYYKILMLLMFVLPLLSCNYLDDDDPQDPSNNRVTIRDNSFNPQTIRVGVGRLVLWQHEGTSPHSVTSGSPTSNPGTIFDSGIINSGAGFQVTFTEAGQYPYFCKVHGTMMTGVVNVQ